MASGIGKSVEEPQIEVSPNLNTSFESIAEIKDAKVVLRWRYGIHDLFFIVKEFFTGRTRPKRRHDTFSDVAESLVAQIEENNTEAINASKLLLEQQRMIEDTRARRRLEKWATRVISWYLILVFALVVGNGVVSMLAHNHIEFITGGIMAAILTTTTINVIGLGLIVLRGHFPNKNDKNKD